MTHQPNELSDDFKPYADKIVKLVAQDETFAKMFEAYEELNEKIYNAEQEIQPRSDFNLEDLKKRRLSLKDQIILKLSA